LKGEELKKFSLKRRQIKVSAYALKGREIAMFLPLQGGGQEGDGVSV
jgi:hypothetical protein